jgi:N-acetylglutamate synthase-like GNAT family acetyltransferase
MTVTPFRPEFARQVVELIVEIQRTEFGIPITAEDQPDLRQIERFYQTGDGNFWVALSGGDVVGTIALLDIGSSQAALRKMFVDRRFRGGEAGTAQRLLDTLVEWSVARSIRDIFLGTTSVFVAAHRFYEKNGFTEIPRSELPPSFPLMQVDTKFYRIALDARSDDPRAASGRR